MIKAYLNIGIIFFLIEVLTVSCKSKINNQHYFKNKEISFQLIDLNNLPQELRNFPLSWERFGIENGDTVTYKLCFASNPEFTLSNDFKSIQIISGNELYHTFKISSIQYNDSIYKFNLESNNAGFNDCSFIWIDKKQQIGRLLFFKNQDSLDYLPKSRLIDKKVLIENCDETD